METGDMIFHLKPNLNYNDKMFFYLQKKFAISIEKTFHMIEKNLFWTSIKLKNE